MLRGAVALVRGFTVAAMLGAAAMGQTMPPPGPPANHAIAAAQAGMPQQAAKPEQDEPVPPPAPSASMAAREEIEAGIKAQSPCRVELYPCELTTRSKLRMFEK